MLWYVLEHTKSQGAQIMASDRINTRLSKPLAEHIERMVGANGVYETPSEYVRDLIRRDMENSDSDYLREAILEGYRDIASGRYFKSTGNFKKDMALLKEDDRAGRA